VLRELNNELRAAGETAGRSLVSTAQDRAVLELIADQTDRRVEQSVVFPPVVDHLDAEDVVRTIERERVPVVTVVGDAMARPLVDPSRRASQTCRRWRLLPMAAYC